MNLYKRLFVGMATVVLLLSILNIPSFFVPTANAITSSNFSVYPGNPDSANDRRAANDAFSSHGDDYRESGWRMMKVYAKDFLGLGDVPIPYNVDVSVNFNCTDSLTGPEKCDDRQPVFAITYYCSAPNGKPSLQRPSNPDILYEITYGIVLSNNGEEGVNAGNGVPGFINRDGYNGHAGIIKVVKTDDSPNPKTTREIARENTTSGGTFKEIIDPKQGWGIADAACRPPASITGAFSGPSGEIKNYNKLSDAQKDAFKTAVDVSPPGTIGSGQGNQEENIDSLCQKSPGTFSGGLAWIVCPLINIGVQATDTLFTQLIQPLMEDVPVSTKTDTGTYIAWQSFRTIGNIVLIGTLLAVVYAQVKGDR